MGGPLPGFVVCRRNMKVASKLVALIKMLLLRKSLTPTSMTKLTPPMPQSIVVMLQALSATLMVLRRELRRSNSCRAESLLYYLEGKVYDARIRIIPLEQLAKLLYDHGYRCSDSDGIDVR